MENTLNDLTKDQKYLLTSMYKEVLSRYKKTDVISANYFQDSIEINKIFLPHLPVDYISALCWQLKAKGYLNLQIDKAYKKINYHIQGVNYEFRQIF